MLKYFFAILVFFHGLIHFMGFAKAFGYGDITQLTKEISKPAGTLWFMTALLFIAAVILFLLKRNAWPVLAILAVVISQVLIITVWQEAKFGTIANLIILLVAIPAFESVNFSRMVKKETTTMLPGSISHGMIVTKEMLAGLPPIVQQWMIHSGVVGKEKVQFVRLKQAGEMRIKPTAKWMPFTATQYFRIDKPAFNWETNVHMTPFVSMNGRDKFENGKGEMLIKALGLVNLVKASGGDKMNQSTMMRFLAEMCWFPSAALADYIKWELVDATSARAIMNYKGTSVSGVFQFDTNGDVMSFTGDRWYGNDANATKEEWFVETNGYSTFQGIRIPGKSEVSWKLKKGDFNWLYLRIMNIEYNKPFLYNS